MITGRLADRLHPSLAPRAPNEKIVLYTMNADGSGLRALPKGGKTAVSPAFFPNGRRIVYLDIPSGRLKVINCSPGGKRVVFSKPQFGESGGTSANVYTVRTTGRTSCNSPTSAGLNHRRRRLVVT